MHEHVYCFGNGKADGRADLKDLLGGKGANLAEMTHLGLPVPPGFTLTTEVCRHYYKEKASYPEGLKEQVADALGQIESILGASFGSPENPLLVSVRSGARVSMPGMMDTILNLGLNEQTVDGLAKKTENQRFAYDGYRRFIQMYSDVVLGISPHYFEAKLNQLKQAKSLSADFQVPAEDLKQLCQEYLQIVKQETGVDFPQDPQAQLWGAIGAVFESWMSPRAVSYRRINRISEHWGTAVNIQAMVFGNMGMQSATGVAFTRDPSTGEKRFFGEYLPNAQGEDVVAGIRTPFPLNKQSIVGRNADSPTLEDTFAKAYAELETHYQALERHYGDMQDIEFTIQEGRLFLLQTRSGKRAPSAAIRISVEMVEEGLIDTDEALRRVTPLQVEQLLHPRLDPKATKEVVCRGLAASPGAASGEVVFSSEDAERLSGEGKDTILVRHETSPEDISGMDAARGILTALGGMTSHAAVVARGMGRPCVAGCGEINIDYAKQQFTAGNVVISRGDTITLDGSTGEVMNGHVPTINSQLDKHFKKFMEWVDGKRTLCIRANAETKNDVRVARQFGAEGVGLARTEHMFFGEHRILAVREMIMAETRAQREEALEKLFPMQKEDFLNIFREMKGYPVTIRLLDPPLHEFLPHSKPEIELLARTFNTSAEIIRAKVKSLRELNPMLGHRGCRLGVSFPEIYKMQVRAIMEAALQLVSQEDQRIEPEIMIPFISSVEEFRILKAEVSATCDAVLASSKTKTKVIYRIGTMIEIPRAALLAGEIAKEADFFSFGTNDLTQMTLGLSRDDSGSFLPRYLEKGIFRRDPFVTLDKDGVGKLVSMATTSGRQSNTKLKVGICGEHGGDTESIEFCNQLGFNYVSCSPFRVPVARLAAAQAELNKLSNT